MKAQYRLHRRLNGMWRVVRVTSTGRYTFRQMFHTRLNAQTYAVWLAYQRRSR